MTEPHNSMNPLMVNRRGGNSAVTADLRHRGRMQQLRVSMRDCATLSLTLFWRDPLVEDRETSQACLLIAKPLRN